MRRSGIALMMAIALLITGLTGCGTEAVEDETPQALKPQRRKTRIEEVAPPTLIQQLNRQLERYQPQVSIVSPRQGVTFNSTDVTVKLAVQDFPLFKDEELGLGPHLTLIVDDECYGPIFDVSEPIQLDSLTPGTHTLRVFADRPWHESFKNEGAYAQSTFHIFEPNRRNNPDKNKPLLTYSQPAGTIATEPVLLDFYLTNAPLHWVAREDETDAIEDWRVQATINGETFVLDAWQPVYLRGLQSGNNWIELELLGDGGEPLDNVYNDTVAAVTLDPTAVTNLTRLFRGELPYEDALAIVDPDYVRPEPEPEPEPVLEPEPELEPDVVAEPDEGSEALQGDREAVPEVMIPEEEALPEIQDAVEAESEVIQGDGPAEDLAEQEETTREEIELEDTEPVPVEPMTAEPIADDADGGESPALPFEEDAPEVVVESELDAETEPAMVAEPESELPDILPEESVNVVETPPEEDNESLGDLAKEDSYGTPTSGRQDAVGETEGRVNPLAPAEEEAVPEELVDKASDRPTTAATPGAELEVTPEETVVAPDLELDAEPRGDDETGDAPAPEDLPEDPVPTQTDGVVRVIQLDDMLERGVQQMSQQMSDWLN